MLTIYHNARCRKSREGLDMLKESGKQFEIREYLKDPLTEDELTEVIQKLAITPIQLVRKNEKIWKEEYKDKDLSDKELVLAMVKHPKLIERPIVEDEHRAVIGRPASSIENLIK